MTISTQIITVLDDLCRRFGLAIDWSQENVMPYLQELAGKYINWEIATSWAWIALAGLVIAIGIFLFIGDLVWGWDAFGCVTGIFLAFVGIIICVDQAMDILACVHFPEKQIAEYITDLMRCKT